MFTVRGVDEGGLGGDLDRGPEQMQTYGVCRCWGCYSLVGSCMRSLLVFLSTEHLSSGGTLKTEVASAWGRYDPVGAPSRSWGPDRG